MVLRMNEQEKENTFDFRTDLADERTALFKKSNDIKGEIDGIETQIREEKNVKITEVKVTNAHGAEAIGKPIGSYITIDMNNLKIAGIFLMVMLKKLL